MVVSVNFINGIFNPNSLLIINIHLSFCAKSSEKYGKLLLFLTFKLQMYMRRFYGVGMLDKIDRKLLLLIAAGLCPLFAGAGGCR